MIFQWRFLNGSIQSAQVDLYEYRFFLICPSEGGEALEQLKAGATKQAEAEGISLEILEYKNLGEFRSLLSLSASARPDGVVCYSLYPQETGELLVQLTEESVVPVVSVVNDYAPEAGVSFVGSDSYGMGKKLGEIITGRDYAAVGILTGPQSNGELLRGISDALEGQDHVAVAFVREGGGRVFEAEAATRELLQEYPIDVLCCLDEHNMAGAAQAVINLNRVKEVSVVGVGITDYIQRVLDKGVVRQTIVREDRETGARAIQTLHQYLEEGDVDALIHLPHFTVNTGDEVPHRRGDS